MSPDHFNGLFEFIGALLICLSIKKLWHDKLVRGVSLVPVTFFATWGFWNLYFYPTNNLWWSFAGGLIMVTANAVWLLQMGFYIGRERWRLW